jgi:hypothetical protein
MLPLRYLLIAVACALVAVISLLLYKYRNLIRRRDTRISREEVLARLFLRKLGGILDSPESVGAKGLLKKLNKTMKTFFSELFEIPYEFDYLELNEELEKKGVDEAIRQQIIDYTMKIEEYEYGTKEITEEDLRGIFGISAGIIKMAALQKKQEEAPLELEVPEAVPKPPLTKEKTAGEGLLSGLQPIFKGALSLRGMLFRGRVERLPGTLRI